MLSPDELYVRLCGTYERLTAEIDDALSARDHQLFLDLVEYRTNVGLRRASLILAAPVGTVLAREHVEG